MSSLLDPEHKHRDWSEISHKAKNIFAVTLSLVILIGAGWFVFDKTSSAVAGIFSAEDYPGPGDEDVTVEIPNGATVDEIAGILEDKGVIASTAAFDQAASDVPEVGRLQAGTYQLKTKMKAKDAIQSMLDAGVKSGKKFRIIEGLRLSEQIPELARQTGIPEQTYRDVLPKGAEYGLPAMANNNPEGFLFPDTYEYREGPDPRVPLKLMTANFTRKANEIQLEDKSKQLGVSPRDVVIVASIIEAEVRRPEDRPKVARVLYNRLQAGMKLQLDTTVEYANNKPRGIGATTSDAERANPSPYNTYVHEGLPPAPISAPGKQALEAAANPTPGNWKYFVAINLETGETAFAETGSQHNQNVEKFRSWCKANPGRC